MDEKDIKILSMLMKDARIPKTKIAKELNISETAVRKRIARLEREGVIIGYKATINYKLARMVASLTGLDVDPDKLLDVIKILKTIPAIKSIYLTTGDHVLIIEIVCKSVDELSKIHDSIGKLEGVKDRKSVV